MATRTKIKQLKSGAVIIKGDDIDRYFYVRGNGDYVWESFNEDEGQEDRQVCYGLTCYGNTLVASTDSLPNVIRREYRRMRRAEARGDYSASIGY